MTMPDSNALRFYEEIMLLALRDEKGTVSTEFVAHAIAGAVLADLRSLGRITVDDTKRKLVTVLNADHMGDPVIDACLEKVRKANRRASLSTWINRLATVKKLQHLAAERLCDRGILRADKDKVLLFFTRKIYPEIDPIPEKKIIERLRGAIYDTTDRVDERTLILLSLANGAHLLGDTFGRKEIRKRKKDIKSLLMGEVIGNETRKVIEACQVAVIIATT